MINANQCSGFQQKHTKVWIITDFRQKLDHENQINKYLIINHRKRYQSQNQYEIILLNKWSFLYDNMLKSNCPDSRKAVNAIITFYKNFTEFLEIERSVNASSSYRTWNNYYYHSRNMFIGSKSYYVKKKTTNLMSYEETNDLYYKCFHLQSCSVNQIIWPLWLICDTCLFYIAPL